MRLHESSSGNLATTAIAVQRCLFNSSSAPSISATKITNYLTHYGIQHVFAHNMMPSVSLTDPHEAPLKVEIFKLTPTCTFYFK